MPGHLALLDLVGIAAAVAGVVLVRLLVPRGAAAAPARQPIVLLALHLVARAVLVWVPDASPAGRIASFAAFSLLLASIARSAVLVVVDGVLGARLHRPVPRIFRDIVQAVVYLVVLLVALRTAGVEPGSILTTSALLTAAVALSLQDTLGNLVAGLAIQAERPFDVGDWIQFDAEAKHIGRVVEINWRATKVVTLDEVEVIVPNATLAKAPIVNFTKPRAWSRRSLFVTVPASVPPHRVARAILDALPGSLGVLADPKPSIVTNAFVDGNVEYWIRFFTELFDKRDGVDGAARDRIWYAFARAGIPIAAPGRAVALREVSAESEEREARAHAEERERTLAGVDFLAVLDAAQRRALAEACAFRIYAEGETVVRQGERSTELYIVCSGEVAVMRGRARGGDAVVARLGAGQFFGEMALMTGERRSATVRAASPCQLLAVGHDALRTALEARPEVAEHISRVIAERQAAAEDAADEAAPSSVEERSSQLLGRIRKFFAL